MSSAHREPEAAGGTGNRVLHHPILGDLPPADDVTISLDGKSLTARAGQTIAAAFLTNGIITCRTMPESGEPRGSFCGIGRCTDCLMTVDGELNVRTCVTPVRDGQQITTQQGLGSWDEVAS